jgi:serine/threonine protein kinase
VLITEFTSAKLADFGTSRAKEEEVTMTALGTPLYAAPELMRGEMFDEKVDVYSFGLLLIDLGLREDNLAVFLGEQWAKDYGARAPECNSISFRRLVLGAIWDEGWRPLSNEPGRSLAGAPAVIHTLVVRCCSHKPSERPSFEEILETLSEALMEEIGDADRHRHNTKIGYSRSDITNPLSGVEEPLPSVIARTVGASNEKQRQEQRTEHHLRMSGLFKTRNSNSTRGLAAIRRSSSLAGPKYENPGVFAEQTEV